MEKYSCFNCPSGADYSLKELSNLCPTCAMAYGFPLDFFPEAIGDITITKSLARGFYGATYIGEVKAFNRRIKKVIKVIPVELYKLHKKSFMEECDNHLELSQNSNHVVEIDPNIFYENIEVKFTNGVTVECHVVGMEYLEGATLKEYFEFDDIPARAIAQIAIDLITLLQELRTNEKYHNDLHPGNIIIENLPTARKRFNEIDENIKVVAIDLGSLGQKTKSNDDTNRTGDLHWVADCLNKLSRRITDHPDSYNEKDWRLAFVLAEKADFLKPDIIHQRQITYKDLINQIRDTYHQHTNPWQQELILKSFDDSVNAQSLSPWHVSSLFVDKDNIWTNSISIKGPQVITGMRGCGKTMLLRSLEFHARLMPQNLDEKSNPSKIIDRLLNPSERYLGLYRAIRYLRFSQLGQSNGSIERQELYTDQYLQYNNIQLVDTFIDRGKSAKTFERPDFIKLQAFIAKHYKSVDYLLVDQLDRFSRDAGEAMNMVKQFQKKYSIQIISVTEGIVFDYDTPGSFFRAGLQLLLAEEDNINRSIKVRGGLYTARAKEGRFLTREKPFGYSKVGEGKQRHLEVNEIEAKVVRNIYDMFLRDVPLYKIKEIAYGAGFDRKGNMAIERVLANPVYAGLVRVEPFKDLPGGLFPAIHEPIVDKTTWTMIQSKIKKVDKVKVTVDEEIPLRGVVKCHCGTPLTGAPSRGKSGKYFYYYKCKHSKHNNISAAKAHEQFLNACNLMSVPERKIKEIRAGSYASIEQEVKANKKKVADKRHELDEVQHRLNKVEEKWFKDEINKDTYERWYSTYSDHILTLTASIERLSTNHGKAFEILDNNLDLMGDIRHVYTKLDLLQKRQFVNMVFDGNLYYEQGIYRTPTMMEIFSHNASKMEEKGYLIYQKKRDNISVIPHSGDEGFEPSFYISIWFYMISKSLLY